jgi:hypothetical protein
MVAIVDAIASAGAAILHRIGEPVYLCASSAYR